MGYGDTITANVIHGAIQYYLDAMEIPNDIPVETEFDYIGYKNGKWTLGKKARQADIFGKHERFMAAKITEELTDFSLSSSSSHYNDSPMIYDDGANMFARTWYMDIANKISLVYFTKSKTMADNYISRLRYLASLGTRQLTYNSDYYYYPHRLFYAFAEEVFQSYLYISVR